MKEKSEGEFIKPPADTIVQTRVKQVTTQINAELMNFHSISLTLLTKELNINRRLKKFTKTYQTMSTAALKGVK